MRASPLAGVFAISIEPAEVAEQEFDIVPDGFLHQGEHVFDNVLYPGAVQIEVVVVYGLDDVGFGNQSAEGRGDPLFDGACQIRISTDELRSVQNQVAPVIFFDVKLNHHLPT
jgi:hypothetical protein